MYSIQNRSFICRIALLIVFIEYSFIDKSSSNRDVCLKDNRRNIQYIKAPQGDDTEVDWNTAWNLCSSQNLTLPVICNTQEQDAFANYIILHITGLAWTSGKQITLKEWTWNNGKVFKENLKEPHHSCVYGALQENRSYKAQCQTSKTYYLCQYSSPLCNDNTYITMRNGCLNVSDDDRSWYDARNRCLENGGDLAVLDDDDRKILKNSSRIHPQHSYWIGLRKISWQWNISASVAGEVKFTNWAKETYSTLGECISIDASNGDWKAVGCMDKKKVVCQRTSDETQSSSTPSTVPNTTLVYSGVGVGIVIIIIICIIVIISIVRTTRKSTETNNQSKAGNGSEQNWPEKSQSQRVNAAASAPPNAPEYGGGDVRGVYAEIPLATINKSEEKAINQEPGTVYASVEFQKEQVYQEPKKKLDNAASPTNVGPLGDTYAIPDVKDHAVSSPGNSSGGSDSHPIKVSAQGDVYALPTKNAKSPAANSTGASLYANLV